MQPIEFRGSHNPDSFIPWVLGIVGLVGLVEITSFPAFAIGWLGLWVAFALIARFSRARAVKAYRVRLDDQGIEIRDRRGARSIPWQDIDVIELRRSSEGMGSLVVRYGRKAYAFERYLGDVGHSDLVQALKLRLPERTGNIPRYYYSTEVAALLAEAREFRRLKRPDLAEESYRKAIALCEQAGSPLGLGMIPVLEPFATLLRREKRDEEAETVERRMADLAGLVRPM